MVTFQLVLDLISVAILVVYAFAELRYLPTVNFELLFSVLGMAMALLSYQYDSVTSLALSSIVPLLALIRIIRVTKVVEKWKKRRST